jgi:hypothetical protein
MEKKRIARENERLRRLKAKEAKEAEVERQRLLRLREE